MAEAAITTHSEIVKSLKSLKGLKSLNFCVTGGSKFFSREVGLLDDVHFRVAHNDSDFCLRIRELGYQIIYTPHAVLRHYESVTKTSLAEPGEVASLRERWADVIRHDPFYNPNLTRAGENYGLDLR